MTAYTLCDDTPVRLKKASTASIASALFKRGLRNQFIQAVAPVSQKAENMVGQVFTLRYVPAREDRNPITDRCSLQMIRIAKPSFRAT